MMSTKTKVARLEKLKTYIPGFDFLAAGGLPRGRTTLVAGSAGSAKNRSGRVESRKTVDVRFTHDGVLAQGPYLGERIR